jgi:SAM-dependent methyltransferase
MVGGECAVTENYIEQWNDLAGDWDTRIGDDGNDFHRGLIRPATLRLLNPRPGERILDAACGNGVFAGYLAEQGVDVVAFDYSPNMIEHAKKRFARYSDRISFSVTDATDYDRLISLGGGKLFDKAVSNMAVMGIPDITPLFKAVYELLPTGGVFVFSAVHPCFETPGHSFTEDGKGLITTNYIKPQRILQKILGDNSKCAYHWHRPLHELLRICFNAGFILDSLEEPVFAEGCCTHSVWESVPLPIVMRVRKI